MKRVRSGRGQIERSKPVAIVKGVLSGYIMTILMLFLLTYLLFKFDIQDNQVYIGIIITYILSTLISGIVTGKCIKKNAWIWGTLSGFLYFIILMVVSVMMHHELAETKEIFTMLALCVGGGTLGGMFS